MSDPFALVTAALANPRSVRSVVRADCPSCGGKRKLTVSRGRTQPVVFSCKGGDGCSQEDVWKALEIEWTDVLPWTTFVPKTTARPKTLVLRRYRRCSRATLAGVDLRREDGRRGAAKLLVLEHFRARRLAQSDGLEHDFAQTPLTQEFVGDALAEMGFAPTRSQYRAVQRIAVNEFLDSHGVIILGEGTDAERLVWGFTPKAEVVSEVLVLGDSPLLPATSTILSPQSWCQGVDEKMIEAFAVISDRIEARPQGPPVRFTGSGWVLDEALAVAA